MIRVASIVGYSYSGKSTAAEMTCERLGEAGVDADIIKKDDAFSALGRERYGEGDTTGGYSITGSLLHGTIPPAELHAYMNARVSETLEAGKVAILEGGTRTRHDQAETLAGIQLEPGEFGIFLLQVPWRELLKRSRLRRANSGRYDDQLVVAAAKLAGQFMGRRKQDSPRPGDADVFLLDGMQSPADLASAMTRRILGPSE